DLFLDRTTIMFYICSRLPPSESLQAHADQAPAVPGRRIKRMRNPRADLEGFDGCQLLRCVPAAASVRGRLEWRRNTLKRRNSWMEMGLLARPAVGSGRRRMAPQLLEKSRFAPGKMSLEALFGERREDIARTGAGEGGCDVGAGPEAPVRPLAVGAGQIGRDRLADQIVELGVGEDRAR